MELIKIEKSEGGKDVVDARHLHQVLEIETQFSKWIQRMFEYGFTENIDYAVVKNDYLENQQVNPTPRVDYALTTDCCKHIAMVQRTQKGMEVRQWFIDYEKNSNKPSYLIEDQIKRAEVWIEEQKEKKQIQQEKLLLSQTVEKLQPKADFYDAVTGSKDAIDMGQAAKVLNMGLGRNTLFAFLKDNKVLMVKTSLPYQEYIDRGWFRVIESKYTKPDATTHINFKVVVYQKGLDGIRKLLSK